MTDRKRKISIRKVLQTLLTLIVVTGFCMAFASADRMQSRKHVRSVSVKIRNARTVHFLDEAEVMKLLFTDRHLDPAKTQLARLDIHRMEQIVRSNPWVSDAQVYVDNERDMHVYLTQRVPAVRIFEENGNSYYLDTTLRAMPVSEHYVHYTPVVTGTPLLRDDSAGRLLKGKIVGLVSFIAAHKFWNAQIAQIVMTPEQRFELIPVLGKQRIILGDTDRVEEKLDNLLAFYQQVQNKVGWEKYEVIDLRFQGQVVASPSLPWKAPVDRALSNMNWVKAVMESGPKNERDESATNSDPAAAPAATTATAPAVTPAPAAAKPAEKPSPKPAVKPAAAKAPKPAAKILKPAAKPLKPAAKPPIRQEQKKTPHPAGQKKEDPKKKTSGQKAAKPTARPKPGTHQNNQQH